MQEPTMLYAYPATRDDGIKGITVMELEGKYYDTIIVDATEVEAAAEQGWHRVWVDAYAASIAPPPEEPPPPEAPKKK